jgi:hypothetical protein
MGDRLEIDSGLELTLDRATLLTPMKTRIVIRLLTASVLALHLSPRAAAGASAQDLFDQRIMPIFRSPNPSSCVQCHLSAVDLKDYILPSSDMTFASLRAQGLIDVDHPEKSKILELINMGEKDLDKGATLIHEEMRKAEYEAFAAWIKAGSQDPLLRNLPAPEPADKAGPERPNEIIRHARKNRVLDSFVRNVWSQRLRCFPCHTPHEIDPSNLKHQKSLEHIKKMEDDLGITFTGRLNLFKETPEATMDYLLRASRNPGAGRLPLVNLQDPARSLLLLKPTSKVPAKTANGEYEPASHAEPVTHLGGLKMYEDDFSYKAIITWIRDYASVVGDKYLSVEELPADNWYFSNHMVLMREAPADWAVAARVQLLVHAWDSNLNDWMTDPIAFTQGQVAPKRSVFGALFLVRSPATEMLVDWEKEDPTLVPGRYLIKAYVDSNDILSQNPAAMLGKEEFRGQGVIEAKWGKTFPEAEKFPGTIFEQRITSGQN